MITETYRILLVEDDDEQAELLKEYLTISGPFITERTNTIKGFWEQISSSKYDAIIMDYSLPDGDGISTLGKLTYHNHSLPVFIISGHCDERLAIRAMQLGAKEYLVKGTDDLRRLPSLMHKAVQETRNRSKEQKLLETNRILEIVFNNLPEIVVVWDREGYITHLNNTAENFFATTTDKVRCTAVKDFYRVNFSLEKFDPTPNNQELIIAKRQFRQNESQIAVISKLRALRTGEPTQEHIGYLDVMHTASTAADFGSAVYFNQGDLQEGARFHTIMGLFPEYINNLNAAIAHVGSQQQTALMNLNPDTSGHDSATVFERAGGYVGCILKNMHDLTGSLSDRSDSGSINPTIESAVYMLSTLFQSKDINIVTRLAKNLPTKDVNCGLLLDLWITILRISADRIPHGQPGNIYIQSKSAGNSIQVDIVNDAVPNAEEYSQLEPKDTRKYNAKSTNHDIGMDICLAIIQSLQGSMMIESVPRRGSIMRVTLPVEG
jgi:CheY-like chemotaxis protein